MERRLRVVVTKVGLDGHDRGVKVVAQALRDAGMEVIYAGLRRSPEEIARIIVEEDADVLGLSILSGALVPLVRRVTDALAEAGVDDVLVVVGGIIPKEAVPELNAMGVEGLFGPGAALTEMVEFIRENAAKERKEV
jgi:methylmalonyl-CoA mutase C-terminal domain/subunit